MQAKKPIVLPEFEEQSNIADLEEEDTTTVPIIFRMPKKTYKNLGQIALNRETSRVALVREAIKEHLKKLEEPEEQNPKISDRQLDRVLNECSKEDGGFEIDGESGFVTAMETKGFKLKDLTPQQWKRVKENLQIGYEDYWSKPSPEEFGAKFESLKPTEKQREWLSGKTTDEEDDSEESEESKE
jgi:hypothetical protein